MLTLVIIFALVYAFIGSIVAARMAWACLTEQNVGTYLLSDYVVAAAYGCLMGVFWLPMAGYGCFLFGWKFLAEWGSFLFEWRK